MMEVISLIVTVSSAIFSFIQNHNTVEEQKRKEIGEFLHSISHTLTVVAENLSADIVPHGACANMREYALNFPKIVDGYMPMEKAQELSDMLVHAQNVEMLIIETRENKQLIERIRFAAWRLEAAAIMIRMK